MNIRVQQQKPSRGEGSQGELRVILMSGGTFLYVKAGNQWHSLNLVPTESSGTHDRQKRGDLQRKVLTVAASGAGDHDGDIMDPTGKQKAALPDVPT